MQNNRSRDFTASDGCNQLIEFGICPMWQTHQGAAAHDREVCPMLSSALSEQIKELCVHNCHDEIEGIIGVGDDNDSLQFSDIPAYPVPFRHMPSGHEAPECQTALIWPAGNQDAFCRLAGSSLYFLYWAPQSDWVPLLPAPQKADQRRF
jgi:hypothetical protein